MTTYILVSQNPPWEPEQLIHLQLRFLADTQSEKWPILLQ